MGFLRDYLNYAAGVARMGQQVRRGRHAATQKSKKAKDYLVVVPEVWEQTYAVRASSAEDARRRVVAEGESVEELMEYVCTLDPQTFRIKWDRWREGLPEDIRGNPYREEISGWDWDRIYVDCAEIGGAEKGSDTWTGIVILGLGADILPSGKSYHLDVAPPDLKEEHLAEDRKYMEALKYVAGTHGMEAGTAATGQVFIARGLEPDEVEGDATRTRIRT